MAFPLPSPSSDLKVPNVDARNEGVKKIGNFNCEIMKAFLSVLGSPFLYFLILGDNIDFAGHERLGFFLLYQHHFPRVFNKRTEEVMALAESKSQNWTAGPVIWKIRWAFF